MLFAGLGAAGGFTAVSAGLVIGGRGWVLTIWAVAIGVFAGFTGAALMAELAPDGLATCGLGETCLAGTGLLAGLLGAACGADLAGLASCRRAAAVAAAFAFVAAGGADFVAAGGADFVAAGGADFVAGGGAAFVAAGGADFLAAFDIDLAAALMPGFVAAGAARRRPAAADPALAFIVDTSFLVPDRTAQSNARVPARSTAQLLHGDRDWSGD